MTEAEVEKIAGICNAHTLALSLVVRQLCDKGLLDRTEVVKDLQEFRDHSSLFLPENGGRQGPEGPLAYGFFHALKALQLALSQKGTLESVPIATEIRRTLQPAHHA